MAFKFSEVVKNVVINTGNILSLNDITKKPGQNATEELLEALNITLKDFQNGHHIDDLKERQVYLTRPTEDLASKISEHDINDLKIGLKIFVETDKEQELTNALDEAFRVLNVTSVHNVIISYNTKFQGEDKNVDKLKYIWKILEKYTTEKKIVQVGLADVDENVFRVIFDWANIKPAIIQINLATCCVVPPSLQAFCKDNAVQLLTHSDPNDILPGESLKTLFGSALKLMWTVRFLVHIKCRGVLQTKGYLINLNNQS